MDAEDGRAGGHEFQIIYSRAYSTSVTCTALPSQSRQALSRVWLALKPSAQDGGEWRAPRARAPRSHRAAPRAQAEAEEVVPLTEEERVAADIYMLRSYRCNSPPVNPYAEADKEGDVALLHEVFEPGRWRIDSKRERRSVNHAKIMASLDADGASSPYVKARDPDTGVSALHAAVSPHPARARARSPTPA